jgi:hypothetical protein
MRRFAFVAAACFTFTLAAQAVFAQATKAAPQAPDKSKQAVAATPTTQAPAAPAKYYKPLKGIAAIQVIPSASKKVGDDVVTVIKVKNMSKEGSIALLKVDEYWYDDKGQVITGDTQSWRKPFNPGEIIEFTMKSPFKPGMKQSQYMYSHANGKIDVKRVKKFDEK